MCASRLCARICDYQVLCLGEESTILTLTRFSKSSSAHFLHVFVGFRGASASALFNRLQSTWVTQGFTHQPVGFSSRVSNQETPPVLGVNPNYSERKCRHYVCFMTKRINWRVITRTQHSTSSWRCIVGVGVYTHQQLFGSTWLCSRTSHTLLMDMNFEGCLGMM